MGSERLWSVVLFVGLELVLLAAGGDTIRAYLSDYEVVTSASGASSSTLAIRNVGPLQSTDTLAIINMNESIAVVTKTCPEGSVISSDRTLTVHFEYMTYGMPCNIVLDGIAVPHITMFTAKGMPDVRMVQGEGRTHAVWTLAIGAAIIGQLAIVAVTTWICYVGLRDMYWYFRTRMYIKTKNADKIAEYIKLTYGIKISYKKASVIEIIMNDEISAIRISKKLSLPLPYVRVLLQRLQDDGLLSENSLDPAVKDCIGHVLHIDDSQNKTTAKSI